ncbi:MAG: thiE [Deltaproteobacteria bacterium]|nr:thiE [Deltaproteobacteria bacterium]
MIGDMRSPRFSFPHRLYPIVDTLGDPHLSHVELAQAMLDAGARLLQLRVKDAPTGHYVAIARAVKMATDRAGALLIINDRCDIAQLIDAAGVHLGQDDLPVVAARQILGPNKIIGWSTHNADQVEAAVRAGVATYIGFGPIFPTTSKARPDPVQGLEGLRRLRRDALPLVAIGGITARTMADVLAAGADAVAMIGEVVRAQDVRETVRRLLR